MNHALKIAMNNNGKLVDKPNLHSAIDRYRNIVKDAGLTGKISPHSLRYAYSREATEYHMQRGFSKRKPKRWFLWIWGTGTGAGIMWREFITKESLMTISLYKIYECISLSNFAASSLVAPGNNLAQTLCNLGSIAPFNILFDVEI